MYREAPGHGYICVDTLKGAYNPHTHYGVLFAECREYPYTRSHARLLPADRRRLASKLLAHNPSLPRF